MNNSIICCFYCQNVLPFPRLHVLNELLLDLAAAVAKSHQSRPTLCNPIDGSPPGSTIPGILQARTVEWVAISFSNAWKWKVKMKSLNRVWLWVTPWTEAYQAPPSMGFSRQEYWSGLPVPSPLLDLNLREFWRTKLDKHFLQGSPSVSDNVQGVSPAWYYFRPLRGKRPGSDSPSCSLSQQVKWQQSCHLHYALRPSPIPRPSTTSNSCCASTR